MADPEEGHVVVVISWVGWIPVVSEFGEDEDAGYFELSKEEFFLARPILHDARWFIFHSFLTDADAGGASAGGAGGNSGSTAVAGHGLFCSRFYSRH